MNIGIITFHWATNYGAVLQSYALQEALRHLGHNVCIINYKPTRYDDTLWAFVRYRKFMSFAKYLKVRTKEHRLSSFRNKYLILTKRFRSQHDLESIGNQFDTMITGSDQVLNKSFLVNGESGGSTAYFLGFGPDCIIRFAYAASFGSTDYPQKLIEQVKPLISRFSAVSARENTGLAIFKAMGAKYPVLVPDPTLLHTSDFYDKLLLGEVAIERRVRAYFLRGRECTVSDHLDRLDVEMITDQSVEQWINAIKFSSHFITNSFHGVVFCLLFHVPFTVVLESKDNIGMNDRFYTLLDSLSLTKRIFTEREFNSFAVDSIFDWDEIDKRLNAQRKIGLDFLRQIK